MAINNCSISLILKEKDGIKICGRNITDVAWVEIRCNRSDAHARDGDHWFEADGFNVHWKVEPGIWLA